MWCSQGRSIQKKRKKTTLSKVIKTNLKFTFSAEPTESYDFAIILQHSR